MKKLLILILITLWAFVDAEAQSNYFITSVADVEITETGSGQLSEQNKKDTSKVATSQRFWFLSPKGYDPGSQRWYQAGLLNVALKNLSSTQWKAVTLYDFTGTNLLYSQNIAPSATIYFDFGNNKRLDASKDYYWKFENIASQSVVCNNDTKTIAGSNYDYIDVLSNDLNLPIGTDCRLKAGQTLTGGLVVTKDQFTGLKVTTSSQQGSFSFVYEAVNNGTVLGQATATITVGASSQYCTLSILSEQLQAGSQTIHEFTLYSPNAQINPFNYEVRIGSYTGALVKSGTTPTATSNKEIIDFGTLITGTYYVTFSSTVSTCFDMRTVSHVAKNDACNVSIISIDKLNGTNSYSVNSSFSNVTSIKSYLTDAQISVGSPLLSQTGITSQSFTISLSTLPTGTYFLNIEGEGKYCKVQKTFEHTLVVVTGGGKLETWTKFIHNYKDNWIISGKNDYESGRDKFGLQTFDERANNVVWKAFISDFENLGNSNKAKAIIGFRKDTSRNEVGVSVAITPTSIILQQRSVKSGVMNTLATVSNVTTPVWIRLTKTGSDIVADFSKDLTLTPVYQELGRISGVFSGWTKYQKYIGVASAKTDVIASARFQGQLGGIVNFASSTITIDPPVIASNVASPSSGQSVTLSTTTSCVAPNTNKWYKNTDALSFSAGATVNVQAYNTDSYFARCENGLNKSVKSNVVTFTITNLLSCNNGTQLFEVVSAVYSNGNVTFSFNASNFTNTNWTILNGSTVIKSSTVQPTANTQTISSGTLSAGNYIFKLDGISCNGSAQKAFTVSGSAPVITSNPASPVGGDNITLTATGCVGNYNWYVSGQSSAYATNSGSLSVQSVVGGTYYYATCINSNVPSNYINIGAKSGDGSGTGQVFFSNAIKSVPTETVNGKYSPHLFPTISIVNSIDPIIGKSYPNWAVAWQAEGGNFSANNRKTPDVGIPFMYDQIQGVYGGYGTRCVDYLSFFYPNTSDPNCLKPNGQPYQFSEFTSAIPFEQKAWATYGQANVSVWDNYTLQNAYDEGINASSAVQYGWGDKVNGKVNVGLANADIETGYELGQDGSNKHLAFLQGMANNSQGYIFSQYSSPLNVTYIDPSNYPTTNVSTSGYPAYKLNPDGTNRGSGSPQTNTVPFSNDWNPTNTLSLTSKTILDYKNALPSAELSSYADATFKQGETFTYNNSGNTRVANKFYPNPNVNHVIAGVIHAGEINKWFVQNKLDSRKVFLQSKITCDRGAIGLNEYNEYGFNITNSSLAGKQFDREYSFDIGGFTAMTGCEWTVWDRNYAGHNLDGYNGVFGVINVLYQRKTFGSTAKSFVDLKPTAKFLLWESEISYDNGANYVKDKAQDYLLNSTHIPQRQFITPDGYWGGFLARPENTEATSCILKVLYNGQNYTYTVTADMWETTDYSQRNTALSSLPNANKDYHYFLIKLGGTN